MNEKISEAITRKMLMGLNEEKLTYIKIQFYIETMLSEIEKITILLVVLGIMGEIQNFIMIYSIAILIRRYSGGNHCKTFMGCLFYSYVICCGIVIMVKNCEFMWESIMPIVIFAHLVVMVMLAPINSGFRPTLNAEDVIRLKIKGVLGILIAYVMYCIFDAYEKVIFLTLLFLLIDEIVACGLNYLRMKGVIRNEKNDC